MTFIVAGPISTSNISLSFGVTSARGVASSGLPSAGLTARSFSSQYGPSPVTHTTLNMSCKGTQTTEPEVEKIAHEETLTAIFTDLYAIISTKVARQVNELIASRLVTATVEPVVIATQLGVAAVRSGNNTHSPRWRTVTSSVPLVLD